MQNHIMQVLEEGSCPFIGGPDFACCIMSFSLFR
jgi:hypothetical protein